MERKEKEVKNVEELVFGARSASFSSCVLFERGFFRVLIWCFEQNRGGTDVMSQLKVS